MSVCGAGDKESPEKVKISFREVEMGRNIYKMTAYSCPKCGKMFCESENPSSVIYYKVEYKYCYSCGQRLDWSE